MSSIRPDEVRRADYMAQWLGTHIPDDISRPMWALPILEALLARLVELETRVRFLENRP